MHTLVRLNALASCLVLIACGGGSADADEFDGSEAGAGGAGATGGSIGDGGTAGVGGDAGTGGTEADNFLFVEDFEDGNTDGWYLSCASMEAASDAAADGTSLGAHVLETRGQGCKEGWASHELPDLAPSRIEWWMRSNSRGEIFGSLQLSIAAVFIQDGAIFVSDGADETRSFELDGSQWHRYELRDIDWASQTFSFVADGNVLAAGLDFPDEINSLDSVHIAAVARYPETTGPVSVHLDELVFFP